MDQEKMDDLKNEAGVADLAGKRQPRFKNLERMTKKELIKEASSHRKEIKLKEKENDELKATLAPAEDFAGIPISPMMFAGVAVMVHQGLAARFGDHWNLQEHEAIAWGEGLQKVYNRYLPEIAGEHKELVALASVAFISTGQRIGMSVAIKLSTKEPVEPDKEPVKPSKKSASKKNAKP